MCFSTQHSRTLYTLKRRIVLDDARKKIIRKYTLTVEELWRENSNLTSVVQQVHSVLTPEDLNLLSNEALVLIFDGGYHSMRDKGNTAAHEAPLSDLSEAVLEAKLTNKKRDLLIKIYRYAYEKEPEFEQSTS